MTKADVPVEDELKQRVQKAIRRARAEIRQREGRNVYYLRELIADAQVDVERKEKSLAASRNKLDAFEQEQGDNESAIEDMSRMVEALHGDLEGLDDGIADHFVDEITRYTRRTKIGGINAIHSGF